jgi:hypothetical protein
VDDAQNMKNKRESIEAASQLAFSLLLAGLFSGFRHFAYKDMTINTFFSFANKIWAYRRWPPSS